MSALPAITDLEVRKPHEWTKHHGGPNPCTEDARVMVRYRNDKVAGPYPARTLRWKPWPGGHRCAFDIISYKLEDAQ